MGHLDELSTRCEAVTRLRTLADQVRPQYKIHDIIPAAPVAAKPPEQIVVDHRWYIAHIQWGQERDAIKSLGEAQIKTFSPKELYWVVEHRKNVAKMRALFPRYLFAGLPINRRGEIDTYRPKLCDGVHDLLRCGGVAISLPETLIGDLMWEDERRDLEFVWDRASQRLPKRLQTSEMTKAMHEVLEAEPERRMGIFMEYFGPKSKLNTAAPTRAAIDNKRAVA